MRLKSRLRQLEQVAPEIVKRAQAQCRTRSALCEPWCDERIAETALGVMAGRLAPGEFFTGMPEPLRPMAIEFVSDVLEAAKMARRPSTLADRRAEAWLEAFSSVPGEFGSPSIGDRL